MISYKLGILGCGYMGSAILESIVKNNLILPNKIIIFDVVQDKSLVFKDRFSINIAMNEVELVQLSEYVLISVKPQSLGDLLKKIKNNVSNEILKNKCFISIAAGHSIYSFKNELSQNVPIIRAMPNLLVSINKSATAICFSENCSIQQINFSKSIFNSLGITVEVKEELIDVITGLSGSGPAYIAIFIEALCDGAVKMGLPRDIAYELVLQTVEGTAQFLSKNKLHPAELKDRVASPAGTTIEGIFALENGKFRYNIMRAVVEAVNRSKELSKSK